ncbi:MAG TPA: FtsX-like permease family protein [Gemmataceae bacterium]|nr:FtsX-like permease family protein [Gemmataceae bacterium]
MLPGDLVRLALSALYQQKVRTALTTLGVVIGTFVLILSLSIGQGVQRLAMKEFRRHDQLRTILVWPAYRPQEEDVPPRELEIQGDMSDAKRERLRQAVVRRWRGRPKRDVSHGLTEERLRQLRAIEHVEAVIPFLNRPGKAVLAGHTQEVSTLAVDAGDDRCQDRIVAGANLPAAGGPYALVNEYVLYRWGVADDAAVAAVLGRKLRLEYRSPRPAPNTLLFLLGAGGRPELSPDQERVLDKVVGQLPDALDKMSLSAGEKAVLRQLLKGPARPAVTAPAPPAVAEELTIVGVLRDATKEEQRTLWGYTLADADLMVPQRLGEELYERVPTQREYGYHQARVRVDGEEHVREVHARLTALGLETYSLVEVVDQVRFNVLLISFATAFVAVVALVVAGLGITNTMLMSVLERTHEIGVMKAVGARDRHVQLLFLVEGTLVGLTGGALGLLLSWLASFPADRVARSLAERQVHTRLTESLFVFPPWLAVGVPLFVGALTMLAAVYPARRAARVNPITALRHE